MTHSSGARGTGTELWLVRVGIRAQLEESRAAFALTPRDLVLAPPGGEEQEWARAFAGGRASLDPDLRAGEAPEAPTEIAGRAWKVCGQALSSGFERLFLLLSEEVLQLVVARALEFPLQRACALRVDPGHAVLLRDDPIGLVLRHSNVPAPPPLSGTALPGGSGRSAR